MNRRERAVLLFLAACFVAGTGVSAYRHWSRGRTGISAYVPRADSAQGAADTVAAGPLDINTASAAALEGLPGVGPVLAQRIIEYRERAGRFESESDLLKVSGIGPKRYAALRGLVVVGR